MTGLQSMRGNVSARHGHRSLWKKSGGRRCPFPSAVFPLKKLKKPGLSFICECKKASPSKGIIAEEFPYLQIAREYEAAGADCISVLTEPKWFLGSGRYLEEIAETVSIPCLRKDFTVDEYMIYEAKILGASAVLLICSILSQKQLSEYLSLCDELGLSALVEAHDEAEVELAQRAGARIIGVNNRNLKDFSVNAKTASACGRGFRRACCSFPKAACRARKTSVDSGKLERMRCWWEKR